jgi:predicted aspartyl protease
VYGAFGGDISIPIQLKVGERVVRIHAKVDTGATFCIFQREHGEELGIDIEGGQRLRISTAAGEFTAFGHEITLESLGWEFASTV